MCIIGFIHDSIGLSRKQTMTCIVAFKHWLKRIEHFDQPDNNFSNHINKTFDIFKIYFQVNKPNSDDDSFVSCVSASSCSDTSNGDSFNELINGNIETTLENYEKCFQLLQTVPVKSAIFNVIYQLTSKVFIEYSQNQKENISQIVNLNIYYFTTKLIDQYIICYVVNFLYHSLVHHKNKKLIIMSIPNLKIRSFVKSSKLEMKSESLNQTNRSNSQNSTKDTFSFDTNLRLIEEINEVILSDLNQPNHSVPYASIFNKESCSENVLNNDNNHRENCGENVNIILTDEVNRSNLQLCFMVDFSKSNLLKYFEQILFNQCMNILYNDLIALEDSCDNLTELFYKKLLADSIYRIMTQITKLHVAIETEENSQKYLVKFCKNYDGKLRNATLTVEPGKKLQITSLPIEKLSGINLRRCKFVHTAKCFKTIRCKQNGQFKIIDLLKISHDIMNEVLKGKLTIEIKDLLNQQFKFKYLKLIKWPNILKYISNHTYQTIIVSVLYFNIYSMSFIHSNLSIISSSHTDLTFFKMTFYQYALLCKNTTLNELFFYWTQGQSVSHIMRHLRRTFCLFFPLRYLVTSDSDATNDIETFYTARSTDNDITIFDYNATVPPNFNGDDNGR